MIDSPIELELVDEYYQTYKFVDTKFHNTEIENYLNSTFQIQSVYGKHSCVIMHERKLYQITPSLGRFTIDLVKRPEDGTYEDQEYHYVLINHLTEIREFQDCLNFIDDEARTFVDSRIDIIFEQINRFNKHKHDPKEVEFRIEYGIQNQRLLDIHTNLKSFDLRGVNGYDSALIVGFMCADLEIDRIWIDKDGLVFQMDSYECQQALEKTKVFPQCINSRTNHQCDVAKCPKPPLRGSALCHEHIIDYENGMSLPSYERGDEGEDIIAYMSKDVPCRECETLIDWRDKSHYTNPKDEEEHPICKECKEKEKKIEQ